MTNEKRPDAVVFGATGFIGRRLLLELLDQGRTVAAVLRAASAPAPGRPGTGEGTGPALANQGSEPKPQGGRVEELREWIREHGGDTGRLAIVGGDVTVAGLGLSVADDALLGSVRDVFNAAALFRFGLGRDEARAANVDGALNVVRWAGTRPDLRRLVHLSGYRVGLDPVPRYPLAEAERDALYRARGAYEASKTEGDAAVRVVAAREGIPLTTVNPSTVIGHSTTGEAGQYIGLADLVRNLWTGRLPALAGTSRTFVPVVTVDHLARFTAAIPEHDPEPGGVHCVLDEDTPDLPELVRLLAGHLGVRAPRLIVPVGLVRRLPTALTGVDPEGLTFLSEDRYDTRSAHRVEAAAGLRPPPVEPALRRWADRLVAERFGTAGRAEPGGFHEIAGSRTYLIGDRVTPAYVLLHGLPVDGEAWQAVRAGLDAPALIADLPGLGRSSPSPAVRPAAGEGAGGRPGSPGNADAWLEALLGPVSTKPVIVAHSAAGAPALRYATAYPDRVAGVLLISPYFLQRPAPWYLRRPALATPMLRRVTPERLASALVGPDAARSEHARRAADSAAAQLHRPGVAARTARWLAAAGRPAERAELSRLLAASPVPVHIVAGELDPLSGGPLRVPVTTVAGAGHHPQISHPEAVVAAATALREAEPAAG